MLIGLTGPYGSGKDVIASYLEGKGFIHYSLSDFLRKELLKEGKEISRNNLIKKGNELRKKFGPGILAYQVLTKLRARSDFVVSSIRNVGEIKVLQRRKDFILVYVEAPLKLRWERVKKRRREGDPQTLKEFKEKEKEEQSEEETSLQLHKCKRLAKVILVNQGSLKELYQKIDKFLEDWKKKLPSPRPSWDEYFLEIVRTVANRATCDRGRSGCLIVKDKRILATGYVGSPSGTSHCDEIGHLMRKVIKEDGSLSYHCIRTTHAEQNALVQAARYGIPIEGATLYCKMEPCYTCAKMLVNAGIKRVVCEKRYHAGYLTRQLFRETGVKLEVFSFEEETYPNQRKEEIEENKENKEKGKES